MLRRDCAYPGHMTSSRCPTVEEIEQWVDEFEKANGSFEGPVRVVPQEDSDQPGALVVLVHLVHAPATVYLTPGADQRWVGTLTERTRELTGTYGDLVELGREVTAAGHLCEHLQRSADALGTAMAGTTSPTETTPAQA